MFNSIKYLIKINLNCICKIVFTPTIHNFPIKNINQQQFKIFIKCFFYIIVYFFWILSTAFSEKTAARRGILIYLHFRIAGIRYHFNLITPNNHKIIFIAQLNMTLYYHRSPTQSMFSFRKFLSLTCQLLLFYP